MREKLSKASMRGRIKARNDYLKARERIKNSIPDRVEKTNTSLRKAAELGWDGCILRIFSHADLWAYRWFRRNNDSLHYYEKWQCSSTYPVDGNDFGGNELRVEINWGDKTKGESNRIVGVYKFKTHTKPYRSLT